MARLARLFVPQVPVLVIQRVAEGELLIRNDGDAELLSRIVVTAAQNAGLELHAFSVMPKDLRLLGTAQDVRALSGTMQGIARSYVASYNRRHRRSGTLWAGRFRSTILEAHTWLLDAMTAVENAPLRAGLVTDPAHYPWTSYRQHTGRGGELALTDHREYWRLGNTPFERQRNYQTRVEQYADANREAVLWQQVESGWALGSEDFLHAIEALSTRRPNSKRRGRPASEEADK